jgi:ribosomal protein S18 acetylase RimI-like enzyme
MPTDGNRSIFIAKNQSSEIIGCCEVIEDRIDLSNKLDSNANTTRRQKKNSRLRPIIENLTVKPEYRRNGIGLDLVNACEQAVQTWFPKHEEVYAQVEEDNTSAIDLFRQCGYTSLFVDPTCTKVVLDDNLFGRQMTISKVMFRKFLSSNDDSDMQLF